MKKIIWKELKEDDPIFKQGFIISSHNRKQIDLVKIHEIANRITKKYHEDGYILSKALGEEQQVKNGIVKVKAFEVYVDKFYSINNFLAVKKYLFLLLGENYIFFLLQKV